jgi:hypothetical protein
MTTLLSLIAFGLAIAVAYLNDKLGSLQSQIAELRETSLDRMRQLHRRIELLEKASADRRMEAPEPIPQPAPQAVAPPIPEPIPPITSPIKVEEPATPPQERTPATITPPATLDARIETPVEPPAKPTPEPQPEPALIPTPVTEQPSEHRQKMPDRAPEPARTLSLEERLGGNWLAKIGVSILVIGVAFFLAPRLLNMGPVGKSLTGIAISFLLLLGGLWLERKQPYRVFARAGISGGWALLFFTTFAMHHFEATRVIDSLVLDLVLMLLVAAGMVLHSLRYNSQTVTGLAFLLAFATLATSDFESASGTVVFSLVASAVLALGLVVVTTIRHWARLELAGLIAVLGSHFLWLSLLLPALGGKAGFPLFWQSTTLILLYWALFRAAYLLPVPLNEEEDRISSLSAVVLIGGVGGLMKLQSVHPELTFRALLGMGTVELLLGLWAGYWASRPRRSAFAVLTTIGTGLLVAAVPYQFHGVSWPVLWLVEAHILALCGLRLGEPIFRRLGLLAGFAASLVLLGKLFLLANFRLESPDPGRHPSLTIGLALAAALFWLHGEVYPRRFANVANSLGEAEQIALAVTSWLGLGAAAAALWVVLPTQWVAVGWLTFVLVLGRAADWKNLLHIALQADLLAVLAIPALIFWDFAYASEKLYEFPEATAILLLYAGMRRRTVLENSSAYVAPAYSWAASGLALVWIAETVADRWLALSWLGLAVVLFALGWRFQKAFLRWQGYVTFASAFGALSSPWLGGPLWSQFQPHGWFYLRGSELVTLLAIVAAACALEEWLRAGTGKIGAVESSVGFLAGALGTLALAARIPAIVATLGQSESASIAWAAMASLLLAVAFFARRRAFQLQGIALCVWTGVFGVSLCLEGSAANLPWWQGNLFRMSLASAILLTGLIFAFPLRKRSTDETWSASWPPIAQRPEQWFFFVPFGLMIVTLAAELRPGQITLGWSLLGLAAFVFALPLGERSFRLAGLALLLLCVAKVLLMDVWTYGPTDRYITLIVTGATLTVVSFLYARLRDFLRKYL